MSQVRLWHDDVRPPPDGWVWARTNAQARAILAEHEVIECSLDHDLGLDHIEMPETYAELQHSDPEQAHQIFLAGRSEDNGLLLVYWMVKHDLVPPVVTIHSWNPAGAQSMRAAFATVGVLATVAPFQP